MKKIIALITILTAALISRAAEPPMPPLVEEHDARVRVQWDPNPEPDISHYTIHWGTNSSEYEIVFDMPDGTVQTNRANAGTNYFSQISTTNTTTNVKGFTPGLTYYFAAKAWNTSGLDSLYSEEVSLAIPERNALRPGRMQGFNVTQIPVYVIDIVMGDVPGVWETNKTVRLVIDADKPYQFFSVSNRMELIPAINVN